MMQQQQQKADYVPLTNEKKAFLKEIEGFSEFPLWYVLLMLLIFITIIVVNSTWDLNLWEDSKYLRRWVGLSFLIFMLLGIPLRQDKIKNYTENGFLKSYPHKDPVITGFLTYATFCTPIKKRDEYSKALIPLLYAITAKEASSAFTKKQRKQLQAIASKPYWHKHEPDLVGAALVGLIALNDSESREILEKLAQKSWPESEKWIGEAAKLCLEKWCLR
jgi:hypothetical protein